ncbi:MAG: hypothetical protein AUK47_03345 [Deltaproteobacteria bacterium CG2_30_63_29]|nr:MAG: hypothetical protein AUK47_03345 [Deltaproteobacteria bacterium CG2_30_63_29]PJB35995.1 MAG: hypothetical protein CO108_24380 [Deltaproteobacteria bacterium CG_4_9_14_3_um_filter_63_12]
MTRRSSIGFDRRIDLAWLDAAAAQVAAEAPPDEMRAYLWKLLEGVLSGDKFNSARGKTVTVLNHIWGEVPDGAEALRQRATLHLAGCTADERLALHWAMMVGTYPVFTDVAAAIGRLLTLQGSFTLAHLTRRLVGTWGERSTLERAGQRIVRSMIQWGVLRDTATRGMYEGVPRRRKVGPAVGTVLIEALLVDAEEASIPLDQLIGHPALFPFEVGLNASHVRDASQFRVHRQGLDSDFVELQGGRA